MNTEKITSDKEEVLKIVNEDWPMLEELGKKRFVINKKKTKDVQDSLNVLQAVLDEDKKLSEEQETIIESIPIREVQKFETPVLQKVQDEKIVVAKEVQVTPSSQTQNLATTIEQERVVNEIQQPVASVAKIQLEKPVEVQKPVKQIIREDKVVVSEKSLDLFKLIIAGLTHLYVSKTSSLLKPMKFVAENYKEVSIAALHFVVPLLMTYFMTTQVGFVTEQLARETTLMKTIYIAVFFFGSTFVWISGQVILSGLWSMLRKSMLDVAKIGKENK